MSRFGSILFRSCAADQNFGINGNTKRYTMNPAAMRRNVRPSPDFFSDIRTTLACGTTRHGECPDEFLHGVPHVLAERCR